MPGVQRRQFFLPGLQNRIRGEGPDSYDQGVLSGRRISANGQRCLDRFG